MHYDYYGWLTLSTSRKDWSDADFDEGFRRVAFHVGELAAHQGNDATFFEVNYPKVVFFRGTAAACTSRLLDTLERICEVFDDSFGQILVQPYSRDGWDFNRAEEIRIESGTIDA